MTVPDASYAARPLGALLDLFATGAPVPGGGPAAGIAAALGASLVTMAGALATAKRPAGDESAALTSATATVHALQRQLLALADQDSVAYGSVLAARRAPKGTAAERSDRLTRIQAAMQAATDVPLATMHACHEVLREAVLISRAVPARARGDLAIGVEL